MLLKRLPLVPGLAHTDTAHLRVALCRRLRTVAVAALCLVSPLSNASAQCELLFHAIATIGATCRQMTVADFNSDGREDIAATSFFNDSVFILYSGITGAPQQRQTLATGGGWSLIADGDFNGDSTPDLAVVNGRDGTVTVFRSSGPGTFDRLAPTSLGSADAVALFTSDVNGDGRSDVATISRSDSLLTLLHANADGTLGPATKYPVAQLPYFERAADGDFNGDGRPDIAIGTNNELQVLFAVPQGGFAPALKLPLAGNPRSIVTGDLNRDGRTDVALAIASYPRVEILIAGPGNSFGAAATYPTPTPPTAIDVGDVNRDGHADLVAGLSEYSGFTVLLNNTQGAFHARVDLAQRLEPNVVAIGDLDGDGFPDIVGGEALVLVRGGPDATFRLPMALPMSATNAAIVSADFNRDGRDDIATAEGFWTHVRLADSSGSFLPPVQYLASAPGWESPGESFVAADFNGDDRVDLALVGDSDSVTALLGNGNGTFQQRRFSSVPSSLLRAAAAGDFSGDGTQDLVVTNVWSNRVSILRSTRDGFFQSVASYSVGAYPLSVATADFNGDGRLDIVTANADSNNLSVLLALPGGTFQNAVPYALGARPYSVRTGDFNRDGRPDLAVALHSSARVAVFLCNANGTFQPRATYAADVGTRSLRIADIDGDGKSDIVVANDTALTASFLRGAGDGTFRAAIHYVLPDSPASLALGDWNADGRTDVAAAIGVLGISTSPLSLAVLFNVRPPVHWINPNGGDFNDPSNWSGCGIPLPDDSVCFDLPGASYTVRGVPATPCRSLRIVKGNVVFESESTTITMPGDLDLAGGSADFRASVDVGGGVYIAQTAILAVAGRVAGDVTNDGTLRLNRLPSVNAPPPFSDHAGLFVESSFIQADDGKLIVEVTDNSAAGFSRLLLGAVGSSGSRLGGSLVIDRMGTGYDPSPGSQGTFPVVIATSPTTERPSGRFTRFDGQSLNEDRFFGVFQRPMTSPGQFSSSSLVRLFVLNAPRRANSQTPITTRVPGNDHLVLVTHGWNAEIEAGGNTDLHQIGDAMSAFSDQRLPPLGWDVAFLDWSQYNGFFSGPWEAALYADAIGSSLATWLDERRIRYEGIHAIGHSAGSWLASSFVNNAINYPLAATPPRSGAVPARCQITLLDAFLPPATVQLLGEPGRADVTCEQYFDASDLGVAVYTSQRPPLFVNYDVTNRDLWYAVDECWKYLYTHLCAIPLHAWPKQWYASTIPPAGLSFPALTPCLGRVRVPGFERSLMFADFVATLVPTAGCTAPTGLVRGATYSGSPESPPLPEPSHPVASAGLTPQNTIVGQAGSIDFPLPGDVVMRGGPSVECTTVQQLGEQAAVVQFEVQVRENPGATLTVTQGSRPIAAFNLKDLAVLAEASNGRLQTPPIPLASPSGPGSLSLTFRLDPFDAAPSEVVVGSLRLFRSTACTPPPSCRADLTCDSTVDDADFVIFAAAYNILDCLDPAMPARCPADLNGDSAVDDDDFVIFLAAYNTLLCP